MRRVAWITAPLLLLAGLFHGSTPITDRPESPLGTPIGVAVPLSPAQDAVVAPPEPVTERTRMVSEEALTIEGVCSDWSGLPLVPVPRIALADGHGRTILTKVDESGAYRVAGLAPGRVRIECSADGHATELRELELTGGSPTMVVDFVLEDLRTAEICILTLGGDPFRSAARDLGLSGIQLPVLSARDLQSSRNLVFRRGGSAGVWGSIELPYSATAEVVARVGEVELGRCRALPGATRVEMRIALEAWASSLATISLRPVRAEDGDALEDAWAWLELERGRLRSSRGTTGRLVLGSFPPGKARLWVGAPGRELVGRELRVAPGSAIDLQDFHLGPAPVAAERTTDAGGRPCSRPRLFR